MYYVIQMKKQGVFGSNYVYGPFSKEESDRQKVAREEMYSDHYEIFVAERLTHSEAVIEYIKQQ